MARRPLLFFAFVCLLLGSQPAAASCEIGEYFIHTPARYLEPSSRIWYFRYEVLGKELRLLAVAPLWKGEEVLPETLAAASRMSIEHAGRLCTAGSRSGAARVVVLPESGSPTIALPHCFAPRSLPRSGYASYDRDAGLLRLSSALPVDRAPEQVPDRSDIEGDIRGNLFELGLTVQEGVKTRIAPNDVERIHFAYTLVGDREQPSLTMAVAILRLRHLVRLFSGDPADDSWKTFSTALADFPVIFFRRPGGEPFYVGDGSWCSDVRLRTSAAPDVRVLDPLESFELTGAYDLDADGLPDLLAVNGLFVYLLAPDGSLQVVNHGMGC